MSAGSKPAAQTSAGLDGTGLSTEEEAFRVGALEGWNRAWAEYYSSTFGTSTIARQVNNSFPVQPREEGNFDLRKENVEEVEQEEAPQFELSAEWTEFFARGEARRQELRAEGTDEARAEEELERAREEAQVPLFLGGARDSAARRRAENLYGPRADAVLLAEARLDATFQAAVGNTRAPLWPVLPLSSWKPRQGDKVTR